MLPENNIIFYTNDVESVVGIKLLKMHQDLELHACLMLETFLVSNQLNSDMLFRLVVKAFNSLSE
jgi:hypothetical protein